MVWKQATDACAGTAVIYGAPDLVKVSQLFSDTDVSDTVKIHECATWTFQSDACTGDSIRVSNPAQTFDYILRAGAIVCADKDIILPVLTGNDTVVFECHIQTMKCKTLNYNCNTFTNFTESFIIAASDETSLLTTGTDKTKFRMPYAFTVTAVRGSLSTVATGACLLTVDINEAGATILTTKLTFDASESTTTTAVTAAVIGGAGPALADDAEITIDIDTIGNTTAGKGLKVYIIGTRT